LQQVKVYLEQKLNEFRDSRKAMFAALFTNFVQAEVLTKILEKEISPQIPMQNKSLIANFNKM